MAWVADRHHGNCTMTPSIHYRTGYKYQLASEYITRTDIRPVSAVETPYIELTPEGVLTIRGSYAWDGPSGPTFDSKSALRGSLEHDAKTQLMRLGLIPRNEKQKMDDEFYDTCVEDGMWKWRASAWRTMLRYFGDASTRPSAEPIVRTAP